MLIKIRDLRYEEDSYINPYEIVAINPHREPKNTFAVHLTNGDSFYIDQAGLEIIAKATEPEDDNYNLMTVRLRKDNGESDERFAAASKAFWHVMQGNPAPAAPAPAIAPKTTSTTIIGMTRDVTKNSGSPFWRCATVKGFMVNVFKHDDPMKDNFNLFETAGYGPEMLAMTYGDSINWLNHPVQVELVQNGSFWNVVKVEPRPDGAMPDPEEADEPDWSGNDE